MEVFSKPSFDQLTLIKNSKPTILCTSIPVVDPSVQNSNTLIVKACEEFGFFKVRNHGVPMEFVNRLEYEVLKFFSLTLSEKEKVGPPDPLGYGNMRVGRKGDKNWVEYLLMTCKPDYERILESFGERREHFRCALNDYISAVRRMTCQVLELLAEGLQIEPKEVFTKLLMDEESDSFFRINHYPPCPELQERNGFDLIGFGEHTDPQIISVLRSNNVAGLQIFLRDGNWVTVPPDPNSFFFSVGDSLQVMTNGRLKSVKHRVLANSSESRVSMIYFGGPPLSEKITPLKSIMEEGEESLYEEFTWDEYKKSAYMTKLADNRLSLFQKKDCSSSI